MYALCIYISTYFSQKVSPGDWERNVDPGEEEGKVLMKILPKRKRWKTGKLGQGLTTEYFPHVHHAFYQTWKPCIIRTPVVYSGCQWLTHFNLSSVMVSNQALCFLWSSSPDLSDALLPMQPSDVLDMPVDPNEPTYCLCHQVSYGEMIGCDNPDVSFHCFF